MGSTSQILAKLGIDSSAVPAELAEANKFFEKFAREAEVTAGTKAGHSAGGSFMKAFEHKFSGRHLATALAAGLGLNIEKIAEKLAETFQEHFGGGSTKAFEEAGKIADEVAKRQQEAFYDRLSTAQKIVKLEHEIEKSVEVQTDLAKTGKDLTAEQLKELGQAQLAQLDAEKKLAEIRKTEKESVEDLTKKQAEADRERLSKQQQIAALEKEILATGIEVANSKDSEGEKAKKQVEMLEKQQKIEQLSKEIAEEKKKAEEKITKEKERQLELDDKIAKANKQIRYQKEDLAEKKATLGDRSKLTVAELAALPAKQRQIDVEAARSEKRRREAFSFGSDAGLTEEQRTQKEKAQKVLDLEAEAEAARVGGDKDKAESLFSEVGQLRESLVASGGVKSTEGDPQKEILKEIQRQTEGIQELVKQVDGFKTAKLKNQ